MLYTLFVAPHQCVVHLARDAPSRGMDLGASEGHYSRTKAASCRYRPPWGVSHTLIGGGASECEASRATRCAMPLHGVYRAALNGVHARGDGGFVFVRGDECTYMFPSELTGHATASDSLAELLEAEAGKSVFYVVEERDAQLHVLAYPRDRVLRDAIEEYGSAPRIEEVD